MAADSVEILIRARNEANSAVNNAIAQLKVLEGQGVKAGVAPRESFKRLSDTLSLVSPRASQAARSMQDLASTAPLMGPVAVGVLAIGAAAAAMSVAVSKSVVALKELGAQAEALVNLSQKTGLATEALQGLQLLARETGVSEESLGNGLRFLNKAIAGQDEALKRLGLSGRSTMETLRGLATAFAQAEDGPAKTALAMRLFGRAGADLIPILNQGGTALQGFLDQAVATGAVLSTGTVQALADVDDAFDRFTRSTTEAKNALLELSAPTLVKTAEAFTALLEATSAVSRRLALFPQLVKITIESFKVLRETFLTLLPPQVRAALATLPGPLGDFAAQSRISAERVAELMKQIDGLVASAKGIADAEKGPSLLQVALETAAKAGVDARVVLEQLSKLGKDRLAELGISADEVAERLKRIKLPTFGDGSKATLSLEQMKDAALLAADAFSKLERQQRKVLTAVPKLKPDEKVPEGSPQFLPREQSQIDLRDTAEAFARHLNEMSSAATTFAGLMDATFQGVAGVFNVFTDALAFGANLMKVRVGDAFRAMLAEMLRAINQFLAAAAVKAFLKFLGVAIGGPIGVVLSVASGAGASATAGTEQSRAPAIDTEELTRAAKQMQAAATSFSRAVGDFEDIAPAPTAVAAAAPSRAAPSVARPGVAARPEQVRVTVATPPARRDPAQGQAAQPIGPVIQRAAASLRDFVSRALVPAGPGPRPVTTAAPTSPGLPRLAPPVVNVAPARSERTIERFQSVLREVRPARVVAAPPRTVRERVERLQTVLREVRAVSGPTPVVRVGAPRTFERERISTTSTRSIERLQTIFRDFRAQVAAPIIRIIQPRSVERERVSRDTSRTTERFETATRSSTVLERTQREMSRSVERFQSSVREFRPTAAPALRLVAPRSVERSQATVRETRAPAVPVAVRVVQSPAIRVVQVPPAVRAVQVPVPRVLERAQALVRVVTAPALRPSGSAIFRADPRPAGIEGVLRSVASALAAFRTGLRLDSLIRPLRDAAGALARGPAGAPRPVAAPPALRVVERAPGRPTPPPERRADLERTQAAARPAQALIAAVARPRVQPVALPPAAVVRVSQVAAPALRIVERVPAARVVPGTDRRTEVFRTLVERTQAAARPLQTLAATIARPRVQTVALPPAAVVRVTQAAAPARALEATGLARAVAAVGATIAGLRTLPRDLVRVVRVPAASVPRDFGRTPVVVSVPMPSGARPTPSSTPQGSTGSTAPPSRRTIHFNVRTFGVRDLRDSLRSGELRDALEREAKAQGW